MNDHARLFDFEADFVAALECIPMAVRFKLDRVGVKLGLDQWARFTMCERRALLETPCETPAETTAWRDRLERLIAKYGPNSVKPLQPQATVPWEDDTCAPDQVVAFARQVRVSAPGAETWRRLTPLERFTLLKLSRDNHDNVNFVPALREFGLI